MEHLLLHCVRTRVLWELLFSLFGIMWVSSNTVGDTLFRWKGASVGKKRKMVWLAGPFCLFWKARSRIVFKGEFFFSVQRVKTSFVFLLWIETRKIIQDDPSNIAGFIDW